MRKFVFLLIQFLLTGLQAFAIEWPEIKTYASIIEATAPDRENTSIKKEAGLEIEWMNFSAIGAVGFSDSSSENEPLFRYGAELSFLILRQIMIPQFSKILCSDFFTVRFIKLCLNQ